MQIKNKWGQASGIVKVSRFLAPFFYYLNHYN